MLRTHFKLNFVFGTNSDKCKGRIVLMYLQEGKNHEKRLLQAVLNKIYRKSTGDNHAEDELFQ